MTMTTKFLRFKKLYIIVFFCLNLIQCHNGGFQSDKPSGSISGPDKNNISTPAPQPPSSDNSKNEARRNELAAIIQRTNMNGYVSSGPSQDPNTPVLSFEKTTGNFLIRVPMTHFSSLAVFELSFKKYPGMRLFLETINTNPYISILIPVKYVVQNVSEKPATLPNGDRVPFFPSGEPPSTAIILTPQQSEKIYLYLSPEAIGLFAETKFNPISTGSIFIQTQFTIKNKENTKILGYLSFLSKKGNFNGGFFISYRLDPNFSKILEEYFLN